VNTKRQKVDLQSLVRDLILESAATGVSQKRESVPSEADLLAYFSGKLSPEKKATIERQIVENPESLEILLILTKIYDDDFAVMPAETVNQTTDIIINLIKSDELRHQQKRLKR